MSGVVASTGPMNNVASSPSAPTRPPSLLCVPFGASCASRLQFSVNLLLMWRNWVLGDSMVWGGRGKGGGRVGRRDGTQTRQQRASLQ